MAIKQLTPEQVRTWTLEQKDRWWLENVYRGNMPQLTLRSALTGMLLGGALSLTNLYVGARTGWTLGVGITSVILAFALFKLLHKGGLGHEMTVLENNAMQSIATSAGYMTAPIVSSIAAYTMVTKTIIPMGVAIAWILLLAALGVFFAFPMKKRFINDEQLPFPEGMAAGVVMDALHTSEEREGLLKAKLLVGGGLFSAILELLRSETVMRVLFALESIPHYWDDLLYTRLKLNPTILGTSLKNLTIRLDSSIVLLATGGLMGMRAAGSMLLGAVVNYAILAPWLIQQGIILPNAKGQVTFKEITLWALWGGVACMTTSSLYSFFSKPKVILSAFSGLFKKGEATKDVLAHIELPLLWSVVGVPLVSGLLVVVAKLWFGIEYWLGALAVPLVFVFSLIAVNSTALTAITPGGALAKLTQLTYGVLAPNNITTNLMVAGITSEVSLNASNLLMDIKPGYMLGAKPRQQMVGHMLGAVAGSLVAVPFWYLVLIQGDLERYGSEQLPLPGAIIWKAVAEVLSKGLGFLHPTAQWAVLVGAGVGLACEVSKTVTKGRFPLSGVGLGLAFVLRFYDALAMFLGAFIFWMIARAAMGRGAKDPHAHAPNPDGEPVDDHTGEPPASGEPPAPKAPEPPKPRHWTVTAFENTETICAGVIAGGSLIGIIVIAIELRYAVPEAKAVLGGVMKLLGASP